MSTITVEELETFSLPGQSGSEEKRLEKSLSPDKKYNTGLIVGRFQPLHRGHVYLLRCALQYASSLVICIGSANIQNHDNPFAVDTRKELLVRMLKREQLTKYIKNIFILDDTPDDEEWLHEALKKSGQIDVVIGNNDWVNTLFSNAGYDIVEIPFLKRDVYKGTAIRATLREDGKI